MTNMLGTVIVAGEWRETVQTIKCFTRRALFLPSGPVLYGLVIAVNCAYDTAVAVSSTGGIYVTPRRVASAS